MHKIKLARLFVSIAFFGQSANISAQQLSALQLGEADFFNEFPVVLTATRLKQPQKDAPIATTIIDREMIEASGFTEIPDLLRLAPGMLVNYDSGHILAAGYQFLFSRYTVRMQILVDGRSVYTPLFGEMPWTQLGITIDDIERIEVIRGPSSSSYGPNAMTGVVSIITRDAAEDKGVRVKINRGQNGRNENFVTAGDRIGKLDYKISLANRKDDGFDLRHDGKDVSIANLRGDYQATNKDTVTFIATYNSGELEEDNTFDSDLHPNHTKKVLQASQQLKWTRSLANGDDFSLNFYHQKYHDRNRYDANLFGFPGEMDESARTERRNLEFSHSVYADNLSFTWGVILRQDETTAPQYLYQVKNDTVDTRQVFVNSEINLNKDNILNFSLMADNNDTGDTTYSPRIAWNHHLNQNSTLRFSYAEATRSPFIFEEYTNYYVPDFVGLLGGAVWTDLSDLEPEEIKSFDVGYIALLNNKATELDLRLYKNKLSNLIVLDWDIGSSFIQGDGFNVTGLEASVSHKFNNSKLMLNYARTRIYADDLVYADASWLETGTPEDNLSLLALHDFNNGYQGSLGYYYTGTYQQLCCEEAYQSPRKRLDLTLSRHFKLGEYNSSIKLVLQNITNEEVETELLNNYERQGYISLNVEL